MTHTTDIEIEYALRLVETRQGTGYFDCFPAREISAAAALDYLESHPRDEFMRRDLMRRLEAWPVKRIRQLIRDTPTTQRVRQGFLCELCCLSPELKTLRKLFPQKAVKEAAQNSPSIYLRALRHAGHDLHRQWTRRVRDNLFGHQPLDPPHKIGLSLPYPRARLLSRDPAPVSLESLRSAQSPAVAGPYRALAPAETAARALEKLAAMEILADVEKRHESSLSPIGLLRQWRMHLDVRHGHHRFSLSGLQTAYGRGLDLASARAAYAMEIVERCSSFTSVDREVLPAFQHPMPLRTGRLSDLREHGLAVLDPNRLQLEVPYADQPLVWIPAGECRQDRREPVWIPAQAVFLFFNADEPKLFSGRGSTGIAAGNTMAEAKVAALIEVCERFSEGVMPFREETCFQVETRDDQLNRLFASYAALGIQVQFQDLTTPMGIPCCKCFVQSRDGTLARGTGAHLDARKALLSALTETTYPYPRGAASAPAPAGRLRVPLENLPNYSTGTPEGDLALLEELLLANGCNPVYVDLTRADIGLPVVRAIVPGMEINGYWDRYTRVHPEFFRQYLNMHPECGPVTCQP